MFITDIQIASASDISTAATLSDFGYRRHELVTIVPNTMGVIIAVDSDSVTVLDTFGKVKKVQVQSIKERKNSDRAVSADFDGNPVGRNDLVRVVEGEHQVQLSPIQLLTYQGKSGNILHIFKYYAFVHDKTVTENNGVFVVRAKNCKLQGTSKNAQQIGTHLGRSYTLSNKHRTRA